MAQVNATTMGMSTVNVQIRGKVDGYKVSYTAAAPPDHRLSFSGSALPFANADQAFDHSCTRGEATVDSDGKFQVTIPTPNSYYASMGSVLVGPTLYVMYECNGHPRTHQVHVSDPVPFRTLTYPNNESVPRSGPSFYDAEYGSDSDLYVPTQEELLIARAFRNTHDFKKDGFWFNRELKR